MKREFIILLAIGGAALLLLAGDNSKAKNDSNTTPAVCPDGQCPFGPSEQQSLYVSPSEMWHGSATGVVLDLPQELRQKNWGGGSCVHASNVNLLRHVGLDELADWWRSNYSGGEYGSRIAEPVGESWIALCVDRQRRL